MKRIFWISASILSICFLVAGIQVLRANAAYTIEATIINLGPGRMDDVIVHVTGNQYPLGSINLNSKATALVSASGESHIEISYSDKGIPRRLVVNCYFEPGYKGRILIELSNGKISKITDNIEIGKY